MKEKKQPGGILLEEQRIIISSAYEEKKRLLLTIAARFKTHREEQISAINSFFLEKICNRSLQRLIQIQKNGYKEIPIWFRNYLIDEYRKDIRTNQKAEAYIQQITAAKDNITNLKDIDINDRTEIVIKRIKNLINQRFRKDYFVDVFDLMIEGLSDQVISERLKVPVSTISSAKSRIRAFLKEQNIEIH